MLFYIHAEITRQINFFLCCLLLVYARLKIDYIVVSGDLESHVVWNYTKGAHEFAIRNISSLFRKYFPTTNTYFAIGNHEGVPVDK